MSVCLRTPRGTILWDREVSSPLRHTRRRKVRCGTELFRDVEHPGTQVPRHVVDSLQPNLRQAHTRPPF